MNKLLLVIDMQNDFVTGSLGTAEAQNIVTNVIEKIDNWEGDIVFTQDTHYEDYLSTEEGKKLPIKHCIVGTPGWQIVDELRGYLLHREKTYAYTKEYFAESRFSNWIRRLAIKNHEASMYDRIEVIGLCTNICVIANVLKLKTDFPDRDVWPNVEIVVDASCCAGTTPEMHECALKVMKSCQIDIINDNI